VSLILCFVFMCSCTFAFSNIVCLMRMLKKKRINSARVVESIYKFCFNNCTRRYWQSYLLYSLDLEGTDLAGPLSDYALLVATHMLLPMLHQLLGFCQLSQKRDIQMYELMSRLERTKKRLHGLYVGDESYSRFDFAALHDLCNIPTVLEQQQQQQEQAPEQEQQQQQQQHALFWNTKGLLAIRAGGEEVELHAFKPPQAGSRRAPVRPSEITEEIKPLVEQHVREQMTAAATSVLEHLTARFPSNELAHAMGVIYPSWWQQLRKGQEREELQKALEVLKGAFCNDRPLVAAAAAAVAAATNGASGSGGQQSASTVPAPLSFSALNFEKGEFLIEMQVSNVFPFT
jgi:hypothetical protein